MITNREAEEILKKEYHIDNFLYVINELLLPDFKEEGHDIVCDNTFFASVECYTLSTVDKHTKF